jgi:hypothetical protein
MKSDACTRELDESAAADFTIRQRQWMRAFQTESSWYQAYWYLEPQPQRPSVIGRTVPTLIAVLSVIVPCGVATTARL